MKRNTLYKILGRQKIIFYDLETNGRSAILDQILEAYFTTYDIRSMKKENEYHSYVKNGWTEEFLNKNGKEKKAVARHISNVINDGDTILCGYNIQQFDNRFLHKYETIYGLKKYDYHTRSFDLYLEFKARMANIYYRYKLSPEQWMEAHNIALVNNYNDLLSKKGQGLSLAECCKFYGVEMDESKHHTAKYDAEICKELFLKMTAKNFK